MAVRKVDLRRLELGVPVTRDRSSIPREGLQGGEALVLNVLSLPAASLDRSSIPRDSRLVARQ